MDINLTRKSYQGADLKMLSKIINDRKLPKLESREKMLDILLREEYGYMPPKPDKVEWEIEDKIISNFCAGKAYSQKITLTAYWNDKKFSFPFYAAIPTKEGKHPFFVCINSKTSISDTYMPLEEIIDNGFAILSFWFTDVTSDDGDFTNGLAGVLYENGERGDSDAGKIAMWAWAAQRVMDYAQTLDNLDKNASVVCGHSRRGKTALLAAATDERFKFAYSNNSGCGGASLARENTGETIKDICFHFPYWFCKNYQKYVSNEYAMPFDQHYLLASIAPRFVYVASALQDDWADPCSEMLSCKAASSAYDEYSLTGFVCEDRLPEVGDVYHDGHIGYHLRNGTHYISREDYQKVIQFVKKHNND